MSAELIDARGHRWLIRLDIEGALLLRDHCDVDLVAANGAQQLLERLVDPLFVSDAVIVLSRAQCERAWLDEVLGQKELARARAAIGAELRRFFPLPEKPVPSGRRKASERAGWDLVWELAGEVGIEPWRLTLRELLAAARGRARAEWRRTAGLMAHLANLFRDPKQRAKPWGVDDFDPFAQKETRDVMPAGIEALRLALPPGARDMTKERRAR